MTQPPDAPRDLSSLPPEFRSSSAGGASVRHRATARADRYRRRRKRQVIGVVAFSVLLLAAVIAAVVVQQISQRHRADDQMAKNVCTPAVTPAPASTVTVNVFNMTPRPGMASKIAEGLKARKFAVGTVGNYSGPLTTPGRTSVTAIVKAREAALAKALAVQRQLPDAVFQQDDNRKTDAVDVYLIDQVPNLNENVDETDGGLICK